MKEVTILPADTYTVVNKTIIQDIDHKLITMLYQPIIGYTAVSLYFTLIDELDKKELLSEDSTHHHLMSIMQLKLDEIVIARKKLEAVGLIRTFFKKDHVNNYIYLLYSPMSANDFLNHPILNIVLYNNLGKKEYERIVDYFKIPRISFKDFEDISSNFNQVFTPVPGNIFIENENIRKEELGLIKVEEIIDFNKIISSIPSNMVSPNCFNNDIVLYKNGSGNSYVEYQNKIDKLVSENLPLGIVDEINIKKLNIKENAKRIVLTSDGVSENLLDILNESKNESAKTLVNKIFSKYEDYNDDQTIMAINVIKR